MTYYVVYKITNHINNKIYIGFHKTKNINDNYMGSGRLIKQAIKKYGVENFIKEILFCFDNKEEAELCEASIVNRDFVSRPDTYNMSIGGNVCILFGENNGFFGKKHTDINILKAQKTKKENGPSVRKKAHNIIDGDQIFKGYEKAAEYLNITCNKRNKVFITCGDPNTSIHFENEEMQIKAINYYNEALFKEHNKDNIREQRSKACSERFKGKKLSAEICKKRSESKKSKSQPHTANVINKDPEKIRKTAEKHRGMKRSQQTKDNLSKAKQLYILENGTESFGKGKIYIYNQETEEIKRVEKDYLIEDPWIRGMGPRKGYLEKGKSKVIYHVETLQSKRVLKDEIVEYPWKEGNGKTNRE